MGQELPEAAVVVLRQQFFGIRANQEVHVRAGRLLRRVALKFAQEGAGMG